MRELMWVLVILGIVAAVVAVVGHVMWLVAAAVLRQVTGVGSGADGARPGGVGARSARWPHGNTSAAPTDLSDTADDFSLAKRIVESEHADLEAALRQFDRWAATGRIDQMTHRRFRAMATADLRGQSEKAQKSAPVVWQAPAKPTEAEPAPTADVAPAFAAPPDTTAAPTDAASLGQAEPAEGVPAPTEATPSHGPVGSAPVRVAAPTPAPAVEPAPARGGWAEVFAAFMEESHIRWGEIIGGLLIVLCSTALVISRWGEIASRPGLRFGLFVAVTTGLFALGFYSSRRWRLPMTSHGLMVIATLLVPLNFLAIAAYSEATGDQSLLATAAPLAVAALYGALVWQAGRVLMPGQAALLAAAVLGPSLLQLVNRGWADEAAAGLAGAAPGASGRPLLLLALALAPLPIYLGAVGYPMLRAWPWRAISARRGWPLLMLVGLASFAAVLPLGLLLVKAARVLGFGPAAGAMAPVANLYAIPALLTAGFFWRRARRPRLAGLRTTATATGAAGVAVMFASAAAAWPTPAHAAPVAAIDFALLWIVAMGMAIPLAHVPAVACLVMAVLLVANVLAGNLFWAETDAGVVRRALLGLDSGLTLAALAPLVAGAGAWLRFARRREFDAAIYARAAAIVAVAGLLLISPRSLGRASDHGATYIFAGYAAAFLLAGWFLGRAKATWLGLFLLFVALAQGMLAWRPIVTPAREGIHWVVLVFATLEGLLWAAGTRGGEAVERAFLAPVRRAFKVTLGLALPAMALALFFAASGDSAQGVEISDVVAAAWLAALALVAASLARAPLLMAVGQAAAAVAVATLVLALGAPAWSRPLRPALASPSAHLAILMALAALGMAWTVVRLALRRAAAAAADRTADTPDPGVASSSGVAAGLLRTLDPGVTSMDRVITWSLSAWLAAVAVVAVVPGVILEIWPDQHLGRVSAVAAQMIGPWAWAALGLLALDAMLRQWEGFRGRRVGLLLGLLLLGCLLAAGQWTQVKNSALALNWLIALATLGVAAMVWGERAVGAAAGRLGWPGFEVGSAGLGLRVQHIATRVGGILIVGLSIAPVMAPLCGCPRVTPELSGLFARLGPDVAFATPLALLTLTMLGHAIHRASDQWALSAFTLCELLVATVMVRRLTPDGIIDASEWVEILQAAATTAGLFAAGWGLVRFGWARGGGAGLTTAGPERTIAVLGLGVVLALKAAGLTRDAMGDPLGGSVAGAYLAWASVAAALTISALARPREPARRAMHLASLALLGVILDPFNLSASWLAWWGAAGLALHTLTAALAAGALAGYGSLTAMVGERQATDARESADADAPDRFGDGLGAVPAWFVGATLRKTLAAVFLAMICVLTIDAAAVPGTSALGLRLGASGLALGAAIGLALAAARTALAQPRAQALAAGVASVVGFGLAWAEPGAASVSQLDRLAIVMTALLVGAGACLGAWIKLHAIRGDVGAEAQGDALDETSRATSADAWARALRSVGVRTAIGAGIALGVVLLAEVLLAGSGRAGRMAAWAIATVELSLLAAAAGAIAAAARGPAGLSLRTRQGCMYAGEALLGLAFLHLRLTAPELFGGWLGRLWPLTIMALAFGGAGLAEYLRRRGVEAVAQPLYHTASWLPAAPIVAALLSRSGAMPLWAVCAAAAGVYALLAGQRKSFAFALLAIAAGNGALWALFGAHPALAFAQHPQLWLIPPAGCVLIATQLNRMRLPAATLASIRYGCLATIYLASSAEVFMRGVPRSPWLPMLLATLAVLGVLAGMLLRVRSFLFMGAGFLVVALVSMIWHASANLGWTWLWWASGIALGAAIIALFAYFERRRQVMGEVIRDLRRWDA